MPLAKLAINNRYLSLWCCWQLCWLASYPYMRMGVELYPDISNPVVMVGVSFPGASPQDVETMVTKPLEQALSTISG